MGRHALRLSLRGTIVPKQSLVGQGIATPRQVGARNDIIKSQAMANDKAQMPNKAQNPNDKKE